MSKSSAPQTEQTRPGQSKQDNKDQAGPDRISPELDNNKQWDEVSAEPGYQKGDQGGYRGSYDETKYQQVNDSQVNPDEQTKVDQAKTSAAKSDQKGDDDGHKSSMTQHDRASDKRDKN